MTKYRLAGFTLVEICVALLVLMLVGGIAYSMLINSTMLLAKNVSLNSSNTILRSALDRIYSEVNQANNLPTLININPDGTSTVVTSGPAAGIIFDQYVGGPYIVGNPGTGLSATATSFNLYYSSDALASPPAPVANDVVIMDGSTRALVAASPAPSPSSTLSGPVPTPAPNPGKMVTVTLQNTLGSYMVPPTSSGIAIPWTSTSQQTAYLLHRKAFAVVPVNGRGELRLYPNAETVTNFNNPAGYVVLTREIGTNASRVVGTTIEDESKPFQIVAKDDLGEEAGTGDALGASFLRIGMRVEDQQFNTYLKGRYSAANKAKEFNTFLRIDTRLRPRNFIH